MTYAIAFSSTGLTETRVALRPGPRHGSFAERLRLGSDLSIRKHVILPRALGFQDPYLPATWWEWEAPADGALFIEMSGYLQVRRYLIDGVDNLILEEADTVTAGSRYAIEVYSDGGNSGVINLNFAQQVSGNTHEEARFVIPSVESFTGLAESESGSLHWEWHSPVSGVIHLKPRMLSDPPFFFSRLRVRRSDEIEFRESHYTFPVEGGVTYHSRLLISAPKTTPSSTICLGFTPRVSITNRFTGNSAHCRSKPPHAGGDGVPQSTKDSASVQMARFPSTRGHRWMN